MVQRNIIEEFVSANVVSAVDIQEVMDSSGVSSKGYSAIQRSVSQALVAKGIKKRMLPKPSHVWKLRGELNSKQFDYFGPPFHIKEQYKSFTYDEFNNIFMDLEILQQRMVEYYNITIQETGGVLQFALKMDECEILKDKKMERVTITLMNRALSNVSKNFDLYFSMQCMVAWSFSGSIQ